ncbi:O-antigen ligase family protein [Sulfurimonas sp. SAG-AH-194-C21]|nr:O-antigen ligase family protein [Sulfurimonas sp. SAG-AH-194-C21]MDF1882602.1 O-antigen ligase family protein [Sulfurimonas sp. SAG-AH-194-C21]
MKIVYKFKPLLILIAFIGYCFISVLWSDSFSEGFCRVFNFHKYYFLFGTALLLSLDKAGAIKAIKVLLFSFTTYALFSLLVHFNFIGVDGISYHNPEGLIRFSISTQYMVITTLVAMILAFDVSSRVWKIIYVSLSLVSLLALLVNYSRASQLTFLFTIVALIVGYSLKNTKFAIGSLIILVIIVFSFSQNIYIVNKFNIAIKEAKQVYTDNVYSGSFGVRLYFNKVGFEILKENLLFGMGPVDNRTKLVEMEKNDEHYQGDNENYRLIKHFHSEHMEILTAYGLVGYLLILTSIVLLVYKLPNNGIHKYMAMSVFLTLFFVSFANKTLTLKPLNYIYIIFFILFSIIAYQTIKQEEKISTKLT